MTSVHPEIQKIFDDLGAADRDARAVVEGLTDAQGGWREMPGSWSVSECLDHLSVANRVYIASMRDAAEAARARSAAAWSGTRTRLPAARLNPELSWGAGRRPPRREAMAAARTRTGGSEAGPRQLRSVGVARQTGTPAKRTEDARSSLVARKAAEQHLKRGLGSVQANRRSVPVVRPVGHDDGEHARNFGPVLDVAGFRPLPGV